MAHPAKRVTLWFQDEARVGQKGRLCHRWWLKGQRPPGLCDHRFDWTYIFAAAQPATGDAFALVLPEVSTEAMDLFLAEFSKTLPPDEHALMVVDPPPPVPSLRSAYVGADNYLGRFTVNYDVR